MQLQWVGNRLLAPIHCLFWLHCSSLWPTKRSLRKPLNPKFNSQSLLIKLKMFSKLDFVSGWILNFKSLNDDELRSRTSTIIGPEFDIHLKFFSINYIVSVSCFSLQVSQFPSWDLEQNRHDQLPWTLFIALAESVVELHGDRITIF